MSLHKLHKYNVYRVKGEELGVLSQELLSNLFGVLDKPVSEENEYVMKGNELNFYELINMIQIWNVCKNYKKYNK